MTTDTITEFETTEKEVEVLVCDKCSGYAPADEATDWVRQKQTIRTGQNYWESYGDYITHLCPECTAQWLAETGWNEGEQIRVTARDVARRRIRVLRAVVGQWTEPGIGGKLLAAGILWFFFGAGLYMAVHQIALATGVTGVPEVGSATVVWEFVLTIIVATIAFLTGVFVMEVDG